MEGEARLVATTLEGFIQQVAVACIGNVAEACPMGLVPTASTTAMLVMGDALAMCLFGEREATQDIYARCHPAGPLGRKLLVNVDELGP